MKANESVLNCSAPGVASNPEVAFSNEENGLAMTGGLTFLTGFGEHNVTCDGWNRCFSVVCLPELAASWFCSPSPAQAWSPVRATGICSLDLVFLQIRPF